MAGKRALGGWAIALIVVDVILVAVLVVLLVTSPTGSDPEGEATTTGAEPTATASEPTTEAPAVEVPEGAADIAAFSSPSRNIWCEIDGDAASCTIASFDFSPPTVADCTSETVGHYWQVDAESADAVCSDDEVPDEAPADLPDLSYGSSTAVGDILCTSERDGVTCVSVSTGHGFSLARGGTSQF